MNLDFSLPIDQVAPRLLGAVLVHDTAEGTVAAVITEVEAYDGSDDPASHAFRGRTPRNAVMFGPAGYLYVYRSHGLHWCANVVSGAAGVASAVLLRAGRLVEGSEIARELRGPRVSERDLTRGPGRLCQALGIDASHYGANLLDPASAVRLEDAGGELDPTRIRSGPRVGVSKAAEIPWRFWVADEPSVSPYRRSERATRP